MVRIDYLVQGILADRNSELFGNSHDLVELAINTCTNGALVDGEWEGGDGQCQRMYVTDIKMINEHRGEEIVSANPKEHKFKSIN